MIWLPRIFRSQRHRLEGLSERAAEPVVIGRQIAVLRFITAVSWLVPLLLLGAVAWQVWQLEMEELDERITSTLSILSTETERVFENQEMALDWIDDRTKRLSWAEIENSRELFEFEKTLVLKSPYIDTIFLADAAGMVRASSGHFPVDRVVSVADRDYFLEAKREPKGVYIGDPVKGRMYGSFAFRVARRRSSADSAFDGIVAIALSPSYIEKFFAAIGGAASDSICLMRTDGTVLVSKSGAGKEAGQPSNSLCTSLLRSGGTGNRKLVSTLDGSTRMGDSERLHGYPLAVAYVVDLRTVRNEWLRNLASIVAAAVTASLLLFGLSFAALRIALNERRAIGAWQDEIEQRQRLETDMRQASKMEALGRMAGGIAHHFNNLLPAMSGLLKLTLGEVPPDSATAKRLERILDAVAQGQQLVRNILWFSRRQVVRLERVAVSALIEDTLALVEGGLPTNVTVVTRLEYAGEVLANGAQLTEVLMNLISNAAHAIGTRDGRIELTTEPTTINADAALHAGLKPGEFVRVTCRDNGAGMRSDVIERAFDPFFTTKPAGDGTGLGLAIVHGIVTGLGGSVQVESTPGVGSSFSLYIPVARDVDSRPTAAQD
jgi:two-component system NtrC family sensor kinase